MDLIPVTMDDLGLFEFLQTDPTTMAELGGPIPREGLEAKLRGIVRNVAEDRAWYFTIHPDGPGTEAVGTVCIWDHAEGDETINEMGWMVAPVHQGRGYGRGAVEAILEKARAERRWDVIHAYPGVTNVPSNAICARLGFTRLEERDIEYAGRTLRCNHWRIDLTETG